MNAPLELSRMIAADAASTETPLMIANVSRRKFLQGASALGGLVLAVGLPASLRAEGPPKYGADGMPHGWIDSPLVFVAIGEDGIVSIVCHRSEMGQGVHRHANDRRRRARRTGARAVCRLTGDEARYGNQDTDGSRSTRHLFMPMCCAARPRARCRSSRRRTLERGRR
jgi:isoquinoline 1-oxidoreductase beta subunit